MLYDIGEISVNGEMLIENPSKENRWGLNRRKHWHLRLFYSYSIFMAYTLALIYRTTSCIEYLIPTDNILRSNFTKKIKSNRQALIEFNTDLLISH